MNSGLSNVRKLCLLNAQILYAVLPAVTAAGVSILPLSPVTRHLSLSPVGRCLSHPSLFGGGQVFSIRSLLHELQPQELDESLKWLYKEVRAHAAPVAAAPSTA